MLWDLNMPVSIRIDLGLILPGTCLKPELREYVLTISPHNTFEET